jgi:hypothetical protein
MESEPAARGTRTARVKRYGAITISHVVATLCAFTLLVTLPALALIALYFALLVVAVVTDAPLGSPVALPFWLLAVVVLGGAASTAACLAGFVTDLARRALRWPLWTPPVAVFVLAALATVGASLVDATSSLPTLARVLAVALAASAVFAAYWIPFCACELGWFVLQRAVEWLAGRAPRFRRRSTGPFSMRAAG